MKHHIRIQVNGDLHELAVDPWRTLNQVLREDLSEIDKALSWEVAHQSFFSSDNKVRYLINATAEKIGQMKNRLSRSLAQEAAESQQRTQALSFLEKLEHLKQKRQNKELALAALAAHGHVVVVDQIMTAMFQKVFNCMYPDHWPSLAPSKWHGKSHLPTDITTYQATL